MQIKIASAGEAAQLRVMLGCWAVQCSICLGTTSTCLPCVAQRCACSFDSPRSEASAGSLHGRSHGAARAAPASSASSPGWLQAQQRIADVSHQRAKLQALLAGRMLSDAEEQVRCADHRSPMTNQAQPLAC